MKLLDCGGAVFTPSMYFFMFGIASIADFMTLAFSTHRIVQIFFGKNRVVRIVRPSRRKVFKEIVRYSQEVVYFPACFFVRVLIGAVDNMKRAAANVNNVA